MSGRSAVAKPLGTHGQPEVIELTPEYAMQLLEHNTLNRPLSQQHVNRIANQITTGEWKFNGDTIKVASTGDVLDGQHRLWAVIEAKRSVETIIVYGIERDAFATIDTLRRMRSGADVLALSGAQRYRGHMAMALKWLILWQRGKITEWQNPHNRIENADIERAYADNPAIAEAVKRVMPLQVVARASTLAFLYYVFVNRNEELAERMVKTLENPSGVSMDDPFFRLRAYLTTEKRTADPLMVMAIAIKAANAAFEGRSLRALSWRRQGQTPEPFPTLVISRASSHAI